MSSEGLSEPMAAIFYNDQQPDKIFYQGLALLNSHNINEANSRFEKLINYGLEHEKDHVSIDYFAVSLPDLMIWEDDLDRRNHIHCLYMKGLGFFGLKKYNEAEAVFNKVLEFEKTHLGVTIHLKMLKTQFNEVKPI